MKVIDFTVKFREEQGVVMRLYVKAAPTGGGTPSRVFEMDPETAKSLGHALSYWECSL